MYRGGKKAGKEEQCQYGSSDWYSDDDVIDASAPYTQPVRGRESIAKAGNKPVTKGGPKSSSLQTKGGERSDCLRTNEDGLKEKEENGRVRQWLEDIEENLREFKEELNIEDTPSSFITAYAKWHRRNVFYIDGLVILVLVVMFGIIIAGRYYDGSPDPDKVTPIPDKDLENRFQAIENRIKRNFKDLKSDLDSDISDFKDNEFSPLTSDFSSLRTEYDSFKWNMEKEITKYHGDITKMTGENDEFKKNQNQELEKFKSEQAEALKQSQTQLKDDQKAFRETLKRSVEEQQNNKIEEIESGIDKKVYEQIEDKPQNFQYDVKDVLTWKKVMEDRIQELQKQITDANTMIILVVIIIVFTVVLVVMLMLRQKSAPVQHSTTSSSGFRSGNKPMTTLQQVKEDCVKDNTVCFLHFHKESKVLCVNLTKTVEPDSNKQMPYFLDNHSDILTIPRSKVIIVYVENNKKNIILEDPDHEVGDLKRTTVEAACRMGAKVVVVYMHHEDSRNLGNNELYCPKLQSVTRHYVLSKLEKQDTVFSVFDSFNDFQRQHMKKLISDSFIKK